MKRIGKAIPVIAATMLLVGCGSVDGVGLESVASDASGGFTAQDGRSLPDGHPPLPPGHPPVMQGPRQLPPGHPAVPEGLGSCPAGGLVREPGNDRPRDFKADSREVISI
jgi:hypothetical protein